MKEYVSVCDWNLFAVWSCKNPLDNLSFVELACDLAAVFVDYRALSLLVVLKEKPCLIELYTLVNAISIA